MAWYIIHELDTYCCCRALLAPSAAPVWSIFARSTATFDFSRSSAAALRDMPEMYPRYARDMSEMRCLTMYRRNLGEISAWQACAPPRARGLPPRRRARAAPPPPPRPPLRSSLPTPATLIRLYSAILFTRLLFIIRLFIGTSSALRSAISSAISANFHLARCDRFKLLRLRRRDGTLRVRIIIAE